MDETQFYEKVFNLQESLRNLCLHPIEFKREKATKYLLVGNVMNSRIFRMFTIMEIIYKTWRVSSKVQVEKINDNVFKFCFVNNKDCDNIFHGRPWSLNGALLILKEWYDEEAISEVKFDNTTFHIQVHRLPPKFLHEDSAIKIGNQIGSLHLELINKRTMVGHKYIRIRVDIDVHAPIPAGFF